MSDGSRHSMYAVKEATRATTPNNPAFDLVRITGTTLGLSKDSLQSQEIRSDRMIADFRQGANQVNGDINFELSYGSFDKLLLGALVAAGWAADTPAAGTDQAKAGITRHYFSFLRHFADMAPGNFPYFLYKGCEINSMQLTIAANSIITGVFSVVGQSQTLLNDLTTLGTPTYPTPPDTAPLDSFTGELKEDGNVIAVVTEITLNLQNGIAPRFVVGSKNSILPSMARSNLTGQITAFFEDASLINKFINEENSSIEFSMPDGAGNIQTHIIPRIVYTGGKPDVTGEGPISLAMPFQAKLDPTSGTNYIIQRTPA